MIEPEQAIEQISLIFDLERGYLLDATVAGMALISWADAVKAANDVVDPGSIVQLEIISAEIGSLKFRAILRFTEEILLGKIADSLTDFPRIKKIVVASVLGIPAGLAVAIGHDFVTPASQANLTPASIQALEDHQKRIAADPLVKSKVQRFYGAIDRDRSVTGIRVEDSRGATLVHVPRGEFAERSGLWEPQPIADHIRPMQDVWDVVVTKPALKGVPLAWRFERDGLPFNAKMDDPVFLDAVRLGTLPIGIQEGVQMRVRVEWSERLTGQSWEFMPRSRRIVQVLSPRPSKPSEKTLPLIGQRYDPPS